MKFMKAYENRQEDSIMILISSKVHKLQLT